MRNAFGVEVLKGEKATERKIRRKRQVRVQWINHKGTVCFL